MFKILAKIIFVSHCVIISLLFFFFSLLSLTIDVDVLMYLKEIINI